MNNNGSQLLSTLLKRCRQAFLNTAVFSLLINVLLLTTPIYMLQLFDRVIVSQSINTLIYLTLIAILALITYAILDALRARLLQRVSAWLDSKISPEVIKRAIDSKILFSDNPEQGLADVSMLRQFVGGQGLITLFDLPWVAIYVLVIFFLSFYLGIIAVIGVVLLIILAFVNDFSTRHHTRLANSKFAENQSYLNDALKNAEAVQALAIMPHISAVFNMNNQQALANQTSHTDRTSSILSISKFIRLGLQVIMLGMGAYLVIAGQLSSGGMLAASIILGRALAPIESSISTWKQFISARQAKTRLQVYLSQPLNRTGSFELPKIEGALRVENLSYLAPGVKKPLIYDINFNLQHGHSLAVIGPSGSGKSTLLKLITGVYKATQGEARLDGNAIIDINEKQLQQAMGYLPQTDELFKASIKENISRLSEADDSKVVAAAKFINIHHMILKLKNAYSTEVNERNLSKGQLRRIALARAFYQSPRLVVLDCPEAFMDQDGLINLKTAIDHARTQKITLIIATDSLALARKMDHVLILQEGRMQNFGSSQQLLAAHTQTNEGEQ